MPKTSAEHKQRSREAILDGALECFARAGYERTSVDDIARAVGRSIGTLYNYFASKEDIFLALARREIQADLGIVGQHLRSAQTFDEALGCLFAYVVDGFRGGRGLFPRVSIDFWTHGLDRPSLRAEFEANVDALREAIVAELSFGTPDERQQLANLLVALTDGLFLHMSHGFGLEPEELLAVGERLRDGAFS